MSTVELVSMTDSSGLRRSDSSFVNMPANNKILPSSVGLDNAGFDGDCQLTDGIGECRKNGTVPTSQFQDSESGSSEKVNSLKLEESLESHTGCCECVYGLQTKVSRFYARYRSVIRQIFYALLFGAYCAYLAYCISLGIDGEDDIRLLWVSAAVFIFWVIGIVNKYYGAAIYRIVLAPIVRLVLSYWTFFKWFTICAAVAGVIIFIVVEIALVRPSNLISLVGYFVFLALFYIFSLNRSRVVWRPVIWGLGIQFVLALLIIRTSWGYETFKWLGDRVSEFMEHTDAGAIFVFGDDFMIHFFAFKVLPTVIFFSCVVSVLYHLGAMQAVILKLAWVMQRTLGTTAAESVNAAGNIFIGQTEAPLLIAPFLETMTRSELFAVMTGGFATIAGSVLAAYILFGVPANHLISASVMAAPCALACAKLMCPEVEETSVSDGNIHEMTKSNHRNAIEAASSGASQAIKLVANIAANLIAFLALLEFVNMTLYWFGARAGFEPPDYPPLSFELICSYLLYPFAWVMGIASDDCRQMGRLIGTKIFLNEFVAFTELGVIIDNTEEFSKFGQDYVNGTWEFNGDDIYLVDTNSTLVGGIMEDRSIVITTYALCGFANIGSIGVTLGGLSSLAPSQRSNLASCAFRAMLTGTAVSFLNACVAGLLYSPTLSS